MKSIHWVFLFLFLGIILFFPFRIMQIVSLFVFFLILVLWTICVSSYSRVKCQVEREEYRGVPHERIDIKFSLKYSGIFPLFGVILEFHSGGLYFLEADSYLFNLKPGENRDFIFSVSSQRRGEFIGGPFVLKASDPSGFFSWQKEVFSGIKFIIYPEIHYYKPGESDGSPGGNLFSNDIRNSDTTRLKNIRPFVPGDSLKYVHWKASARTGQLQVKEFERTLESPLVIYLEMNRNKYPSKSRYAIMEQAVSAAASIAEFQFRQAQALGFITNGLNPGGNKFDYLPLSKSDGWFLSIMNILAVVIECEKDESDRKHHFLSLPARTRVALVTPYLDEKDRAFIHQLKLKNLFCELYIVSNTAAVFNEWESFGIPLRKINPLSGRIE